jgi:16S rRNA (guanine527-N7)-methyltransferase
MEIIHKYFPDLNPEQEEKLARLENLYADWNSKINLISRKDIPHLYERHVLHSLSICKFFSFAPGLAFLDVGTGGGFPGIPLAIMFPDSEFTLVDSIGKKIRVVKDIADKLQLKNCRTVHSRVEQVKMKYDFIVSRAVTNFNSFFQLVKKNLEDKKKIKNQSGIIYLKGGDVENEIQSFKEFIEIFSISDFFTEEFFQTKKIIFLKNQ